MAEKATPEFARYRYLMRPPTGQRMILRVDRLDPTKNVRPTTAVGTADA